MDLFAPLHRLDDIQIRHRNSAILFATIKKFSNDSAGNLAAMLTFYGFFSIFPLLLVFVTVLGYVLAGDQSLLHSVSTSVLARFPVIGPTLAGKSLKGSLPALVIGVVLTLYAGLGITGGVANALDRIWGIAQEDQANFVKKKLRGFGLVVALGLLFAVASGVSGLAGGGLGGPLLVVFGIIVSLLLNVGLFLLSFRLLCSEQKPWSTLLPGAVSAAVLWTLLQTLGGLYIGHIDKTSSAYGTFALVLGLLAWLHLGAQATLYSAELNAVLAGKLWPLRMFGEPKAETETATSGPAPDSPQPQEAGH
jgi:YihY family inner membrane protein